MRYHSNSQERGSSSETLRFRTIQVLPKDLVPHWVGGSRAPHHELEASREQGLLNPLKWIALDEETA
jgi:hypothetical protein